MKSRAAAGGSWGIYILLELVNAAGRHSETSCRYPEYPDRDAEPRIRYSTVNVELNLRDTVLKDQNDANLKYHAPRELAPRR